MSRSACTPRLCVDIIWLTSLIWSSLPADLRLRPICYRTTFKARLKIHSLISLVCKPPPAPLHLLTPGKFFIILLLRYYYFLQRVVVTHMWYRYSSILFFRCPTEDPARAVIKSCHCISLHIVCAVLSRPPNTRSSSVALLRPLRSRSRPFVMAFVRGVCRFMYF